MGGGDAQLNMKHPSLTQQNMHIISNNNIFDASSTYQETKGRNSPFSLATPRSVADSAPNQLQKSNQFTHSFKNTHIKFQPSLHSTSKSIEFGQNNTQNQHQINIDLPFFTNLTASQVQSTNFTIPSPDIAVRQTQKKSYTSYGNKKKQMHINSKSGLSGCLLPTHFEDRIFTDKFSQFFLENQNACKTQQFFFDDSPCTVNSNRPLKNTKFQSWGNLTTARSIRHIKNQHSTNTAIPFLPTSTTTASTQKQEKEFEYDQNQIKEQNQQSMNATIYQAKYNHFAHKSLSSSDTKFLKSAEHFSNMITQRSLKTAEQQFKGRAIQTELNNNIVNSARPCTKILSLSNDYDDNINYNFIHWNKLQTSLMTEQQNKYSSIQKNSTLKIQTDFQDNNSNKLNSPSHKINKKKQNVCSDNQNLQTNQQFPKKDYDNVSQLAYNKFQLNKRVSQRALLAQFQQKLKLQQIQANASTSFLKKNDKQATTIPTSSFSLQTGSQSQASSAAKTPRIQNAMQYQEGGDQDNIVFMLNNLHNGSHLFLVIRDDTQLQHCTSRQSLKYSYIHLPLSSSTTAASTTSNLHQSRNIIIDEYDLIRTVHTQQKNQNSPNYNPIYLPSNQKKPQNIAPRQSQQLPNQYVSNIEKQQHPIRESQAELLFQNTVSTLKQQLVMTDKRSVFLYFKDGTPVYRHSDLEQKYDQSTCSIIVSYNPCFKGIHKIKENQKKLQQFIAELEHPLITAMSNNKQDIFSDKFQNQPKDQIPGTIQTQRSYEQNFNDQYAPIINGIIQTVSQEPNESNEIQNNQKTLDNQSEQSKLQIDSSKLESIYKELHHKKIGQDTKLSKQIDQKYNPKIYKNAQPYLNPQLSDQIQIKSFGSPEEYMASQELLIKNEKIEELQRIDQFYETDLKKLKFITVEEKDEQQQSSLNNDKIVEDKTEIIETQKVKGKLTPKNAIQQIAADLGLLERPQSYLFQSQKLQQFNNNQSLLQGDQKDILAANEEQRETNLDIPAKNSSNFDSNQRFTNTQLKNEKNLQKEDSKQQQQGENNINLLEKISSMLQDLINLEIEKKKKACKRDIKSRKESKLPLSQDININDQEDLDKNQQKQQQTNQQFECEEMEDNNKQHQSFQINFDLYQTSQKFGKNFIEMNKKSQQSKRTVLDSVRKYNKNLCRLNIPKILLEIPSYLNKEKSANSASQFNFTRRDIHQFYTIYKALHETTSISYCGKKIQKSNETESDTRSGENYEVENGIDFNVYKNGLYQVFMQPEDIARKIFNTIDYNYSGFMDWEEFLKLMVFIRAKTLKEKINLFIKIADEDGNGRLSKEEVYSLAKICLGKFISQDQQESSNFLEMLSEYYTKLIFDEVQIDIEDEIPMNLLKSKIINDTKEKDLLTMFCGADI